MRREHPHNALDLGTGSAVLAIALAKLAHIPVLATDIDPVAVKVAAANARLNHVKALVETVTAPGFHHPIFGKRAPFDLIVANILARPLMRLAPEMARHISARRLDRAVRHSRPPARRGGLGLCRAAVPPCPDLAPRRLGDDPPQAVALENLDQIQPVVRQAAL